MDSFKQLHSFFLTVSVNLWNTSNNGEKEVDIFKVDVKTFVTNSNNLEAQFYEMPVTKKKRLG